MPKLAFVPDRLRTLGRRPAALAALSTLSLAALLVGGLAVAGAVEGRVAAEPVDASAEPTAEPASDPSKDSSAGNGDDNTAVAVNTRDGSEVYAIRLKVVMAGGDTVDATNAAVAVASCSDCQTVAIALEGVLITGDATTIAPENIALAINSECDGCRTLAYAYQNVQTTDGKVRLTGAGRQRIAELRRELNAIRTAGMELDQIRQTVSRIAAEFAAVLDSEVVPIGKPAQEAAATDASPEPSPSGSQTPSPTTSPAATATSTTSPSPSPTSSSPSPSPSVSPSPTPSVSPSPSASP